VSKANRRQAASYQRLVTRMAPKRPLWLNLWWAFVVGGAICLVGQGVTALVMSTWGLSAKEAGPPATAVMIFLGALFTGLGLYDRLAPFAGMGANLPITGFANSIVAPALEFKREGFVLGMAARMFTVAGPVIVFAVTMATAVGFLSYILGR
jgi:stage V sporulation protein AC